MYGISITQLHAIEFLWLLCIACRLAIAMNSDCNAPRVLHNSACVLFIESPAYACSLLSCSSQDEYAATPLIAASDKNHIEVTRFLIVHRASVNYQTKVF
jgi:ankyrin repeat protein